MSFFEPNIIAKEQLPGVIGVVTTIEVPTVAAVVGTPGKKKLKPKLKWLQAVRDYLRWKVSA